MTKKKLNITFCSFPDFSSNAKPLYLYMKKRYGNSMNFTWIVQTDEMCLSLKNKGIKAYKIGSDDYHKYIGKTDVFFTTHANLINDKMPNSLYIELWHGISMKQVGFLSGNISEHDVNWCNNLKRKVDYIILPSDFWRVIFSTRYNINYSRTLALGYPKFDDFKDNKAYDKLQKVLGISLNKYKKIIYYMPTFRKNFNRIDSIINYKNIFNIADYDENKLKLYLEKNKYLLCIKKHPSEELDIPFIDSDYVKVITDDCLLKNSITVNEILDASDLLITDYSSLGIEYNFLDKPVIYLVNDIDEYKKNRGITFDYIDFWMPGHKISDIKNLLRSIDDCFSDNYGYKDILSEKRKLWFGNLKDGGCKNICDFLFDGSSISKQVVYYSDYEEKLENTIDSLNSEVFNLKNDIVFLNDRIDEREKQINNIVNSKGWKILEKMRRFKRKILRK